MVSLFNLDDDPQEVTNLAKIHPSLVEELLKEAEEVIKDAPKMFRGDMVHVEAPVSILFFLSLSGNSKKLKTKKYFSSINT